MTIKKKTDTKEGSEYWRFVKRVSEEVKTWPEWKQTWPYSAGRIIEMVVTKEDAELLEAGRRIVRSMIKQDLERRNIFMSDPIKVVSHPPAMPIDGEINLDDLTRWHADQHETTPPPVEPPPVEPPPSGLACRHPAFPYVKTGECVQLAGRTYNTRRANHGGRFAIDLGSGCFKISESNATATHVPTWSRDHGSVLWSCRYRDGITSDIQGGNHYHQIMSYHLSASQGSAIDGRPQLRLELPNLGTRPRMILWPYFTGEREMVEYLPDAFRVQEGPWYDWRIEWEYDEDRGQVDIEVSQDGDIFAAQFMVQPGCEPFHFFYPLGHVGPQDGYVEFHDVEIQN